MHRASHRLSTSITRLCVSNFIRMMLAKILPCDYCMQGCETVRVKRSEKVHLRGAGPEKMQWQFAMLKTTCVFAMLITNVYLRFLSPNVYLRCLSPNVYLRCLTPNVCVRWITPDFRCLRKSNCCDICIVHHTVCPPPLLGYVLAISSEWC